MPIYEYRCRSCAQVIEVIQRLNDRPLRKCRACDGRLEKIISRTSFQLKGGGWYSEGYGGGGGDSTKAETKTKAKSAEPAKTKPAKSTKSSGSSGD